MTLDDEEDFSPEILNHFDSVCTQFARDCATEVNNGGPLGDHPKSIAQNQRTGKLSNSQQAGSRGHVIRLSRKTSFGRICSWTPAQPTGASTDVSYKIEIERLKHEIGALREELYMKVGELASLKEASSRSTNARLEVIRKLEAQLASERAESTKTIAALNSQLAFREADYQLVSAELTQAKMQSCQGLLEDEPSTSCPQTIGNVSPASALLTSIAEGVDARLAKRGGCFPRPISPLMTRTTPSKRPRLWSDELALGTIAGVGACGNTSKSPSPTIPRQGGVKVRSLRTFVKIPPLNLLEEEQSPPTPCKQISSTEVMANEVVAPTPPPLPSPPRKLRFRLQCDKSSNTSDLHQVLGRLILLSRETRCLPRDPKLPGVKTLRSVGYELEEWVHERFFVVSRRRISDAKEEEQASAERDFFSGLSRLALVVENHADAGRCLGECITLILPQIRIRLREYVNFFRLYRQCVFDHTFTEKLQREGQIELESSSLDCSGIVDLKCLNENPFAGAPASQLVSLPSLFVEGNTRSSPVKIKDVELSTWTESTAMQANEGILACLRTIDMIFVYAHRYDGVDTAVLANFVLEALNALAAVLSLQPIDEDTTLNVLPTIWMSRLSCVIHQCLHLACRFALELNLMNSRDKCDSAPSWFPSVLNVYLLVVCETLSTKLHDGPSVLLPALRLLTYLLEGGRLDPPEHSTSDSSSSSNPAVFWWASGGEAEALELLKRLKELEISLDQTCRSSSPPTFHISSKIPPQEQLGCPLHILCRLVQFRQSLLDRDDVRRLCRLLTELSMFARALASTKRWTLCANCPCTLEVYKALIDLGLPLVEQLFTWKFNPDLKVFCLSSLGCLILALHTLLLAHGDDIFQRITDRIPGFFVIISRLSRLTDESADLVHPELVEELHDFDAPPTSASVESDTMYAKVPSCSAIDDTTRRDLAHRLFRLGALNFSGVRLKTGEISPVYFDIRLTMSDPLLLQDIARYMYKMISDTTDDRFDLITGVPAAAIALATVISIQNNVPMILTRKAAKDYGTKKKIEGIWTAGENVLVVEDVVTYGDSIAETTALLRSSGLQVKHAVVVVERQQGATQNLLKSHNVHLHTLLSFDDILNILSTDGLIPMERVHVARNFIAGAQFEARQLTTKSSVNFCPPLASRLTEIMALKSSNTCLFIDSPLNCEQLLQVAKDAAPRIAALEICPNLVNDTFPHLAVQLRDLADKHKFLLIAGRVVKEDKCTGESHLSSCRWADIIIVDALSGSGTLNALRRLNKASYARTIGSLLISNMDYESSLMKAAYTEECIELAKKNADVVVGFVASHPLESITLQTRPEGDVVPSVIYKTPPEHNYTGGEANGHINGCCNGSTTFGGARIGVLYTTCFSSLKGSKVDAL
ncbi:unnamed protein product [Hydatigera taeniaeformis]|uniref:orotate phosphoribosyltransferase n=1 Tax=Hydatigena taeniaeformis TaxID=6205 RepID=A0A0R3X1L5_HYDTA|nr:unnamed protein product [Hydatigera taeniaeformis]